MILSIKKNKSFINEQCFFFLFFKEEIKEKQQTKKKVFLFPWIIQSIKQKKNLRIHTHMYMFIFPRNNNKYKQEKNEHSYMTNNNSLRKLNYLFCFFSNIIVLMRRKNKWL
jgi:hypothetical protein